MTFLAPHMLYVALLCPIAVLLYLLSKRKRRVVVPSIIPWKKLLLAVQPRIKKYRVNLELICAALIPLLAAFALAQPTITSANKSQPISVVIDDSLSMACSTEENISSPKRFDEAMNWLDRIPKTHEIENLYLTSSLQPHSIKVIRKNAKYNYNNNTTTTRNLLAQGKTVVLISDKPSNIKSSKLYEVTIGKPIPNYAIFDAKIDGDKVMVTAAAYGKQFDMLITAHDFPGKPDFEIHKGIEIKAGEHQTLVLEKINSQCTISSCNLIQLLTGISEDGQRSAEPMISYTGTTLDDTIVIDPLANTARIDKTKYPRAALALKLVGKFNLTDKHEAALHIISTQPELNSTLKSTNKMTYDLLLIAPQEEVAGIISIGAELSAMRAYTTDLQGACVSGLGEFKIRDVQLPADAKILAYAVSGDREIPLAATWTLNYKSHETVKIAWLAVAPEKWKTTPGFPLMISKLARKLVPQKAIDYDEHDTSKVYELTKSLPEIQSTEVPATSKYPAAIAIVLAALCAGYLCVKNS